MIIPAVFDATIYHRYAPPELGTTGYWGLFWNDEFAKRWARLRPQWRLSATLEDLVPELQMVENEPVRHACSARGPGFSIKCRINGDPPRLITLAGATRVLKAPTNSLRSGESRIGDIRFDPRSCHRHATGDIRSWSADSLWTIPLSRRNCGVAITRTYVRQ